MALARVDSVSGIPSTTWRMLAERPKDSELPRGLDRVWDAAFGLAAHLKPRRPGFLRRAERIVALEPQFKDWSAARQREEAGRLRGIFRCGRETPADVDYAFALLREIAARELGMKPFVVQVAGALALEAGCVVEMATGEGKTLTATLPATLGGWRGKGCHVITVNDYLAVRDAEGMGRMYKFCGLSVAAVSQEMPSPDRRAAYQADITYGTNKEVTADFLRDRLSLGRLQGLPAALLARMADGAGSGTDRVVQRGLAYAIIDEADSVLIDEAVTPLIISGEAPNAEQVETFREAAALAGELQAGRDYRVNQRFREVDLTEAGKRRLEEVAGPRGGLWKGARRREELIVQALTAREFYLRDKQYVIDPEKKKVVIVDEFTGRLMPDREWRDGLHQAVEAKETLTVNPPKETYARLSFQRFFRLYRRLSGMTGTAAEGWREFWQIYHMPVVSIPTNRPCARRHLPDRVFATEDAKWACLADEIRRLHQAGRAVLVGTRSVRASEHLSQRLSTAGLEHQVLNAVRHAEEAQVVAAAGQPGKITVATNMAGRGTDIKLGQGVAEKGGLHVIASERHEAGRVDRQLYGRCARQGDPGTCQAIVSLEDELVRRHAPHLSGLLRKRYGRTEREVTGLMARQAFNLAQRRAERLALHQRKGVLQSDNWLDQNLGFAGSET
jgi:preprotein translocase subunit SecA